MTLYDRFLAPFVLERRDRDCIVAVLYWLAPELVFGTLVDWNIDKEIIVSNGGF